MTNHARLFITHYDGFGIGVSSPDLRGLIGSLEEDGYQDSDLLLDLARAAGLDPDGTIDCYLSNVVVVEDRAITVRMRHDSRMAERNRILMSVFVALQTDHAIIESMSVDELGEAVILVGLEDERFVDAMDAMVSNQPTYLASTFDGEQIGMYGSILRAQAPQGVASLAEQGVQDDMTVREVVEVLWPEAIPPRKRHTWSDAFNAGEALMTAQRARSRDLVFAA